MALKDSDELRSSDDKKFKGHTDNTIKVVSAKSALEKVAYKARKISTDFNLSFRLINKLRDKLSKDIFKKLK
jgi:hypothetical protein